MEQPSIRLTKLFSFETAHALLGYDGPCRNIHGHSYQLHITLIGKPLHSPGHPKDGMVADFKDIKNLVKGKVVDRYDHALVLNEKTPPAVVIGLEGVYEKIILTPYQPTCENLLIEIVGEIQAGLADSLRLVNVKLFETSTSYAEWCEGDQICFT